ncbi:ATP-binding protein [Psychrobacter sp. I-STPA10]|uniref:ATP-binding protein n=1 Tax=Psychrobacter sp. I-STPA10 TaxID=2585769 RepID=UPI001E32CDBD|nr:ATP-binding protein [Psychrobacter sp. I-STPA10]
MPKTHLKSSTQANKMTSHTQKKTAAHIKATCQLHASHAKCYTNPSTLPESTDELIDLENTNYLEFGQQRAFTAIDTALDIHAHGYHIFATGETGLNIHSLIHKKLSQDAKQQPTANDWIYVHNFKNPCQPIALTLPTGLAPQLEQHMQSLWHHSKKRLQQKFNSDYYQQQIKNIKNKTVTTTKSLENLEDFACLEDILNDRIDDLHHTLAKHCLTPLFQQLKQQLIQLWQQQAIIDTKAINTKSVNSKKSDDLNSGDLLSGIKSLDSNNLGNSNNLDKRYDLDSLENIDNRLSLVAVFAQLDHIQQDMMANVHHIIDEDNDAFISHAMQLIPSRYGFHMLVTHTPQSGAPLVFEDFPTQLNLLGYVAKMTQKGSVYSDAGMIQAGSLHHANGGYLILAANHLLKHDNAWQGLKRTLQSQQLTFSNIEQNPTLMGSLSLSATLTPQPIPLNVKVILLGDSDLYDQLLQLDPEFDRLFKIRADFADEVNRHHNSELAISHKIAAMIQSHQLLPFHCSALAALLDDLGLQAESQQKFSLHSDRLLQLLLESNRHAKLEQCIQVHGRHVQQAINDITERSGYLKSLYWQELTDGQQLISTHGDAIGQINALTIINYADSEFGIPARLTAVVQHNIGTGDILDIERDVELGGSLHAKGMLIMNSYLRALFSPFHGLNFTASLAFEQSYAQIDGDSATLAEACALLSALANTPIHQSYAITGSMNQLGEVQAVGGINAKIAGFYDVCMQQGLTGTQGVIMPAANTQQLMLRDDIVQAIATGQFHLYAVNTLSEALSILTDLPIDKMNKKNRYHKSTLFGRILKRLQMWEMDKDIDKEMLEEDEADQQKQKNKCKKTNKT